MAVGSFRNSVSAHEGQHGTSWGLSLEWRRTHLPCEPEEFLVAFSSLWFVIGYPLHVQYTNVLNHDGLRDTLHATESICVNDRRHTRSPPRECRHFGFPCMGSHYVLAFCFRLIEKIRNHVIGLGLKTGSDGRRAESTKR